MGYKFSLVLSREITDDESVLLKDAGCSIEAVRIPALEHNNYLNIAVTLYGAELGGYIRNAVGNRDEELHFIGKTYANLPPTPRQTVILGPRTWAGAVPRI